MKKIILAIAILVAGYTLSAQETVTYKGQFASYTNIYKAPEPIFSNFMVNYPGVSEVNWVPMNGWWLATYRNEDNRIIHVYYSMQPYYLVNVPGRNVTSIVSLPVLNTYVPEKIITTAINAYGSNLYSITRIKDGNNNEAYQVTLLENGTMRTMLVNPESMAFTDVNRTVNKDDEK